VAEVAVEEVAVPALASQCLTTLGELNEAAAAAGVTDGGAAPAKLTALKLCEKLGSRLKHEGQRLSRTALEHLVLRLVLTDSIRVHFAYTAYTILPYLFTRPALVQQLRAADGPSGSRADGRPTRPEALACTLPSDLLPSLAGASKRGGSASGGARGRKLPPPEAAAAKEPPPSKRKRPLPPVSDDSDFEDTGTAPGTAREGGVDGDVAVPPPAQRRGGRGAPATAVVAAASVEVVVIDDDDEGA